MFPAASSRPGGQLGGHVRTRHLQSSCWASRRPSPPAPSPPRPARAMPAPTPAAGRPAPPSDAPAAGPAAPSGIDRDRRMRGCADPPHHHDRHDWHLLRYLRVKTVAGTPNSRDHTRARAPLSSHVTARPRHVDVVRKRSPATAGRRIGEPSLPGPLNATSHAHCHPARARNRLPRSGGLSARPRRRPHSVTDGVPRPAWARHPGAIGADDETCG